MNARAFLALLVSILALINSAYAHQAADAALKLARESADNNFATDEVLAEHFERLVKVGAYTPEELAVPQDEDQHDGD